MGIWQHSPTYRSPCKWCGKSTLHTHQLCSKCGAVDWGDPSRCDICEAMQFSRTRKHTPRAEEKEEAVEHKPATVG